MFVKVKVKRERCVIRAKMQSAARQLDFNKGWNFNRVWVWLIAVSAQTLWTILLF